MSANTNNRVITTIFDLIVLMAVSAIATTILLRDTQIRMCDTIGDEVFIAHCHFFLHPEHFNKDVEFQAWARVALSSMLNWLPALICKFTQLKPSALFMPLVILQNSLIIGATYKLGRTITTEVRSSRIISILAATFTMLWHPQWWNSALMCSYDWFPYANWVSLPFLLLGFDCAINHRKWLANILIVIGTLIHPILGSLASLTTGIYRILDAEKPSRLRVSIESLLTTGITASLAFIPIRLSTAGIEFAPDTDRLKVLAMNIHATPWSNAYPYGISSFTASLIFAVLLSLIALLRCPDKKQDNKGQLFFISTAITTVLATAAHCMAAVLHIAAVQNLIISRSTILLLATCVPLVMWQFWSLLIGGSVISGLTVLTFLFSASPFTLLAVSFTVLAHRAKMCEQPIGLSIILQGLGAAMAIIVLVYQAPQLQEPIQHLFFEPLFGIMLPQMISQNRSQVFDWKLFILCLVVFAMVRVFLATAGQWRTASTAVLYKSELEKHANCQWLLCITLGLSLSIAACIENRKHAKPSIEGLRNYYEVQRWARDNTPAGSSFILVNPTLHASWRGVTERQTIAIKQILQVYCSMKPLVDYDYRLSQFYRQHPPMHLNGKGSEEDLTTENWSLFAKEFGGDYIVRRKDWPSLQLPLVFRNAEFVIYRLN